MLCINYNAPDMKYIDEAPQIRINYRATDDTLEKFIEIHSNQHIYIDVHPIEKPKEENEKFFSKENIKRFKNLKRFNNWTILVNIDCMDENKFRILPEMCNTFIISNRIDTLEDLQTILSYHPNEIYLTNELCFDLPNIKAECDKFNTKIRVVANVAQCRDETVIPAIKRFFIRPEDIDIYNQYIYGIEFFGDKTIQEICYTAYSRKYWWGQLSEIILGLDTDLDSRRLPNHFGELRSKCGKRCIRGGGCSVCRSLQELTKTLEKTDSILKQN